MFVARPGLALGMIVVATFGFGCLGSVGTSNSGGSDTNSIARRKFPLESLPASTLTVNGQTIRLWLAQDADRQEEGLMYVPEASIPDDQGMLFVFPNERYLSFWMKNTPTSLDIAYARTDGTIVKTYTMPPYTLNSFGSGEPARLALEMKAGSFARLNIKVGDKLVVPADVFKD